MQDLGGGREIDLRIGVHYLRPRGLELLGKRTNELRGQIERDEGGNEGGEVDDGELQPHAAAQCIQELTCERDSLVSLGLEDEDVRAARECEQQCLVLLQSSAGGEGALRISDRPLRVALRRAHLGTDRVDLERAVVRRACLDLGDELIGGSQRLIPLAAAVEVVDQRAFEPAGPPWKADPLGDSRPLQTRCVAVFQIPEHLLDHGEGVVGAGQRVKRPSGGGDFDALLHVL